MPRKSTIKSKSQEWRAYFDKLLRTEQYTLDEILEQMRTRFPSEKPPSRTAAGRYSKQVKDLGARMREIQAAGTALVAELGEDPQDRAGQLMVNGVTTLFTSLVLDASDEDKKLSAKEAGELARGARAIMQARKMSMSEREEIARVAREQLLAEQESNLQEAARAQGLGPEQVDFWRKKVLGIG